VIYQLLKDGHECGGRTQGKNIVRKRCKRQRIDSSSEDDQMQAPDGEGGRQDLLSELDADSE
jgi:hypothetical protein